MQGATPAGRVFAKGKASGSRRESRRVLLPAAAVLAAGLVLGGGCTSTLSGAGGPGTTRDSRSGDRDGRDRGPGGAAGDRGVLGDRGAGADARAAAEARLAADTRTAADARLAADTRTAADLAAHRRDVAGGPLDAGISGADRGTSPAACDQTLSPGANIGAAIASAPGGSVICLEDGRYDGVRLSGVGKKSMVTVRSKNGAATVNVGMLELDNVSYLHLQQVTFTGGLLRGSHLHLSESVGAAYLLNGVSQILRVYGSGANADILIDRIRYVDIPNPCTNNACVEGRISVLGGGDPSGITIANCYFAGGNSDGIQVGGNAAGVRIIGNEFTNIMAAGGTHTDSIQLYGQGPGTVIQGNYFHDTEDGIMAGDGGSGEQILDNVFDLKGYPYGIVMNNWRNGVIRHNTFKYGTSCAWNACGTLWVNGSVNLVVEDNIIGELKVDSGTLREDYNLINVGGKAHDHTSVGLPSYVGGANPSSYAGFKLGADSRGVSAGTDGTNIGIR